MVLVDTSIWIGHLRSGDRRLAALLLNAEVVCHPYITGELACGHIENRVEILGLLQALPAVPVVAADEFLYFIENHQLMGLGIGFVDVHLLASSLLAAAPLWTRDRRLRAAADGLGVSFRG